jgi:hypothetical protein
VFVIRVEKISAREVFKEYAEWKNGPHERHCVAAMAGKSKGRWNVGCLTLRKPAKSMHELLVEYMRLHGAEY